MHSVTRDEAHRRAAVRLFAALAAQILFVVGQWLDSVYRHPVYDTFGNSAARATERSSAALRLAAMAAAKVGSLARALAIASSRVMVCSLGAGVCAEGAAARACYNYNQDVLGERLHSSWF